VKLLSALDPGKQGLKPSTLFILSIIHLLSALDPGKQGLKLLLPRWGDILQFLSALDPGKQGLKHFRGTGNRARRNRFQRLIQENKD